MKSLLLFLFCAFPLFAQNQPLKKFTAADTAKCRTLYTRADKKVEVKFNIKKQHGKWIRIYNAAGKLSLDGRLLRDQKLVAFDFANKMHGTYFLFVYDGKGKAIFKRKIIHAANQAAPTIRPRR